MDKYDKKVLILNVVVISFAVACVLAIGILGQGSDNMAVTNLDDGSEFKGMTYDLNSFGGNIVTDDGGSIKLTPYNVNSMNYTNVKEVGNTFTIEHYYNGSIHHVTHLPLSHISYIIIDKA